METPAKQGRVEFNAQIVGSPVNGKTNVKGYPASPTTQCHVLKVSPRPLEDGYHPTLADPSGANSWPSIASTGIRGSNNTTLRFHVQEKQRQGKKTPDAKSTETKLQAESDSHCPNKAGEGQNNKECGLVGRIAASPPPWSRITALRKTNEVAAETVTPGEAQYWSNQASKVKSFQVLYWW